MYRNYRVEAFIPAGRKLTMSLLLDNLYRNKDIVDKVQIWLNTDDNQVEDIKWLNTLPNIYGNFIELIPRREDRPVRSPKQLNTGGFYPHTQDENTIYFRFDDDIIYIDDEYFKNMLDFRIDNPDYFLVFGTIVNNAITSYYFQQEDKVTKEFGIVEEPFCMDVVGWTSPVFALELHKAFLKHIKENTTKKMYLNQPYILDKKRFSVSNFCFFGKDFKKFNGELHEAEEEQWLTEDYPQRAKVLNVIAPNGLCVHFSFFHQREYLLEHNILEEYRAITKQKLSDSYYRLLGNETSNPNHSS